MTNSGTAVDIGTISSSAAATYNTITSTDLSGSKIGTYSIYFDNLSINCTFTSQTFPISVSFWVKPLYTFNYPCVILSVGDMTFSILGGGSTVCNFTDPPGLITFQRFQDLSITSQRIPFYTTNSYYSNPPQEYTGATGITAKRSFWTHLVWVANTSTDWTFYVNNIAYKFTGRNALSNTNTTIKIGTGGRNKFSGNIDYLQVWNNYQLTNLDVKYLYRM